MSFAVTNFNHIIESQARQKRKQLSSGIHIVRAYRNSIMLRKHISHLENIESKFIGNFYCVYKIASEIVIRVVWRRTDSEMPQVLSTYTFELGVPVFGISLQLGQISVFFIHFRSHSKEKYEKQFFAEDCSIPYKTNIYIFYII